jgi:hypothetical protein
MPELNEHRLGLLILLLVAVNFTDAVLTLAWVDMGVATEANPFMNALLQIGSGSFLAVKFTLVNLGAYLLWQFRSRRLARWGVALSLTVYGAVIYAHLRTAWSAFQCLQEFRCL